MSPEEAIEQLEEEPNFAEMSEDERKAYLENLYAEKGPGNWRNTLISKFLRRE
jgi:hypothetical protein